MGRSEGCVRRGNPMSNRWYYDIDGRIGGPITPMQLQLMVNSGMLEAHHKIRKEDSSTWNQAGTVRGLFQEPEPAGQPLLGAASAVAAPPAVEGDPAAAAPAPQEWAELQGNVFDFFSEGAAAPVAPKPQERSPKGKTIAKESPAVVVASAPAANPAPTKPPSSPEVDFGDDFPRPIPEHEPLPIGDLKQPTVNAANDGAKPAEAVTAASPPPPVSEVSGKAVDLLPDDRVRLLEGRTSFRLHRAWLLAVTRFMDGTIRYSYLRLQRLDGVVLEHRHESGRTNKPPHAVLTFYAGGLTVSMAISGSDKPYRSFAEKALLQSNLSRVPTPKGS